MAKSVDAFLDEGKDSDSVDRFLEEGVESRSREDRSSYSRAIAAAGGMSGAMPTEIATPENFKKAAEGLYDWGMTGLLPKVPRVTGEQVADAVAPEVKQYPAVRKAAEVAAGVERSGASAVDFLSSPASLLSLGVGGLIPGGARLVSGLFAADMARHEPEAAREFGTAVGEGDLGKSVETGLNLVANTGLAGLAAGHAGVGKKGKGDLTEGNKGNEEGGGDAAVVSPELAKALDAADQVVTFEDLEKPAAAAVVEPQTSGDMSFGRSATEATTAEATTMPGDELDATPGREQLKGVKGEYERPADIVDWLDSFGKIRKELGPESQALKEPHARARKAFPDRFDEAGENPDVAAEAYRRETGAEMSDEDFMNAIGDAKGSRERDYEAHRQVVGERAQDAAFQERAIEGKRKTGVAVEEIAPEELSPGDAFTVDGKLVVVRRVKTRADDETMVESVTLKDGPDYGVQRVPGGQTLKIDAGSLKRSGDLGARIAELGQGAEAWADQKIAESRGMAFSGIDPELLAAYAVKGALLIGRGARDLTAWATEMVKQYGEGVREHLPVIWKRAQEMVASGDLQLQSDAAAADVGKGERQFPKQVDISSDVSGEVKLRGGPRLYDVRTNEEDAKVAAGVIDAQGLEGAGRTFLDEGVTMPAATRTALGLELVKRWGQEEQLGALTKDKAREDRASQAAVDLIDAVTKRSTEMAQGLQAMSMWGRLTPEGQLLNAKRTIEGARRERIGAMGPHLENMRNVVEKVNEDMAGAVGGDEAVMNQLDMDWGDSLPGRVNLKLHLSRMIMGLWNELWKESGYWQDLVTERGVRAHEIAREHYSGVDPSEPLAAKLRKGLGITAKEAERLGRSMDQEYAKMLAKEAKEAQKRLAKERARAIEKERKIKQDGGVWVKEKAAIGEKLIAAMRSRLGNGGPKPAVQEFASRLGAQLRAELLKRLPERAKAVANLTEEQVLREAANNAEKYQEAWRAAQGMMREEFKDRPEVLAELDKAMGLVSPNLFSSRAVDVLLRREMEAQGVTLRDVVKEHYTKVDAARRSLADKIVAAVGIDGEKAKALAKLIEGKFNARATAAKRGALARLSLPARVGPTLAKGLHERLIELSNLGALDDGAFDRAVGEKLKLPVFSREMAQEVRRRAEAIQKAPEGFQRERLVADLMNYVARSQGVRLRDVGMGIWFANILSGPPTHAVNAGANALNLGANVAYTIARTGGRGLPGLTAALARGFEKGGREGAEFLKTGIVTGSRLQKPEASRALELKEFKGTAAPLNTALKAYRYVGRAMGAADLLFFKPAEEMRAYALARDTARREGLTGDALKARVVETLGLTRERIDAARAQADAEGLAGRDWQRRVDEIAEQARPGELRENAKEYALRTTFNQKPWGFLGAVAQSLNMLRARYPIVSTVAPFVNIVANVVNEGLNYTPVGGARAVWGSFKGELEGKPISDPHALYDQYAKAAAGLTALAALAVWAKSEEDQADPKFMVTGAGPQTPEQAKQLRETGWMPYSVKVGDRYYAYQNTPLAIGLSVLGNYMDAVRLKELDKTDVLNRTAYALRSAGKVVLEQSFLSGIADLIKSLESDSTKSAGDVTGRGVFRTASSFVVPSLVKWIDQVFDPQVYDAKDVEAQLVASVPFARRLNRPAINVLGEPVTKYASERFTSAARPDPLWRVLADKQAWVGRPERDTVIGDKKRGEDHWRTLNDDEFYLYVKESGLAIREKLMDRLDALRDAEPDKAKAMVHRIVAEEREKARKHF